MQDRGLHSAIGEGQELMARVKVWRADVAHITRAVESADDDATAVAYLIERALEQLRAVLGEAEHD